MLLSFHIKYHNILLKRRNNTFAPVFGFGVFKMTENNCIRCSVSVHPWRKAATWKCFMQQCSKLIIMHFLLQTAGVNLTPFSRCQDSLTVAANECNFWHSTPIIVNVFVMWRHQQGASLRNWSWFWLATLSFDLHIHLYFTIRWWQHPHTPKTRNN